MFKNFLSDIFTVWVLVTFSISIGIVSNQFRNDPLPLLYQSKDYRLQAEVSKLLPTKPVYSLSRPLPAALDIDQFHKYVDEKEGLIFDARPELFYQIGHVPGSISLPRDTFLSSYGKLKGSLEENKSQVLVVYCSDRSCEDSVMVQKALVLLGYTHVSVFRGGWYEWTQAGFPIEKE